MKETIFTEDVLSAQSKQEKHAKFFHESLGFEIIKTKSGDIPNIDMLGKCNNTNEIYKIEAKTDSHTTKNIVIEAYNSIKIGNDEENRLFSLYGNKAESITIFYDILNIDYNKYLDMIINPKIESHGILLDKSIDDFHILSYYYPNLNRIMIMNTKNMKQYILKNIHNIKPDILITKTVRKNIWNTISFIFSRELLLSPYSHANGVMFRDGMLIFAQNNED